MSGYIATLLLLIPLDANNRWQCGWQLGQAILPAKVRGFPQTPAVHHLCRRMLYFRVTMLRGGPSRGGQQSIHHLMLVGGETTRVAT